MMTLTPVRTRSFGRAGTRVWSTRLAGFCAGGVLLLSGCNNAGEGLFSGAALGALGGMAIGSLTGDMGKGAAAGAVVGGLGGLILGDQNNRRMRD